ncbi:MAG: hypothetical protein K0R51_1324 [Cytophagaceae bacterium]|nr:hypothetical protein [Cytophagaceae bacterium]
MSGWQDSNLRPPGPKPGAMTGLRYTPNLLSLMLLKQIFHLLSSASEEFESSAPTLTLYCAEREGFEPSVRFNPYGSLANGYFRPLSHLSFFEVDANISIPFEETRLFWKIFKVFLIVLVVRVAGSWCIVYELNTKVFIFGDLWSSLFYYSNRIPKSKSTDSCGFKTINPFLLLKASGAQDVGSMAMERRWGGV